MPGEHKVYTHFIYIAYQVTTVFDGGRAIVNTAPPGDECASTLQGPVGNLGDDARIRIKRLFRVMQLAASKLEAAGDNVNTLKIFTVPEFYFRPDNEEGSYTHAQYVAIKAVLRATMNVDAYNDWLLIPGTIMWMWSGNTEKRPNPAGNSVYFNSSLFIKRFTNGTWDSATIQKVWASSIDGIPTGRHSGSEFDPGDPSRKAPEELWPEFYAENRVNKHQINIATISIGLEICVEHQYKLLLINGIGGDRGLDIQILVGAGSPTRLGAFAIKNKGYFLRNDGCVDGKDPRTDDPDGIDDSMIGRGFNNMLTAYKRSDSDADSFWDYRNFAPTSVLFDFDDSYYLLGPGSRAQPVPQGIRIFPRALI
jgi:hypothetical protein